MAKFPMWTQELIPIAHKSEIITNCVNDLLNINNFIGDISLKICKYTCNATEMYIGEIAKVIGKASNNTLDNKISSIIGLYAGGYSWNANQNKGKLKYSYNCRVSEYAPNCPDGICCMSDIAINTNDYECEILIHGKYDQMWLGITWNPDFAEKYYNWDIPRNAECISYYGGSYGTSTDKGYIQCQGNITHSNIEKYHNNDVIGIRVSDFDHIEFLKNNKNVINNKIPIPTDDNRKYYVFVMLDETGDCVVFSRLR